MVVRYILKRNDNYPWINHPIIIKDDVIGYNYNVREWSGGALLDRTYNEKTSICKSYSSLDDMINDGWRPD